MISIIVAVTRDNAIGKDGDQLYYIKGDLRRFKELTTGNTVIMGRKTFEALPKGALPNRLNIVITRDSDYKAEGVIVADSVESAMKNVKGEVFIIGGAQIYRQTIDIADRLILTEINVERPDADTYFPQFNPEEWCTQEETPWQNSEADGVEYRYRTLVRK